MIQDPEIAKVFIPAVAVVCAAIIAGVIALVGHWINSGNAKVSAKIGRENAKLSARIAKENAQLAATLQSRKQITENRQIWIDALREDLSLFFAKSLEQDREKRERERIVEIGCRIVLRMNPNDPCFADLRKALNDLVHTKEDDENHNKNREDFLRISQEILKTEWETLKQELQQLEVSEREG